jgi:hypothetical protein
VRPLLVSVGPRSSPQVVRGIGLPAHHGGARKDRDLEGTGDEKTMTGGPVAAGDGDGNGDADADVRKRISQPTSWEPDSAPFCTPWRREGGPQGAFQREVLIPARRTQNWIVLTAH